jgi:hypothetical protein
MVEWGPKTEPINSAESLLSKELVEEILVDARRIIATSGNLQPTLFVQLENGERGIVPLSLPETHPEKCIYFRLLGMLSFLNTGHTIREAILVSEAWIVTQPEAQELGVAPSQHPNRKEAITLVGRDAQNSSLVFAIQPFQRDVDNQSVFEALELEHFSEIPNPQFNATGLLDDLFPQGSYQ